MSDSVISIISICVTFILGVVGFIANSLIQRKNNSIEIITRKRLARRDRIQDLSTDILVLTDPDYLECLTDDDKKYCIQALVHACSEMRSILEFEYRHDAELVETAYRLKKSVVKFLREKGAENISPLRNEYSQKMDVYTTTEWQRIKIETVGKDTSGERGHANWRTMYEKNNVTFEENRRRHDKLFK